MMPYFLICFSTLKPFTSLFVVIKKNISQIPKSLLDEGQKKETKASQEKILIKSFKIEGNIKAFEISELQNLLIDLNLLINNIYNNMKGEMK